MAKSGNRKSRKAEFARKRAEQEARQWEPTGCSKYGIKAREQEQGRFRPTSPFVAGKAPKPAEESTD